MLALWLKQWREYQALLSSLVAVTSLAWLGLPDTSWLSASDKLEDKMEDVSQGTREVSETTEGVSDEGAVETEETPTSQPVYGSFPISLTLAVCFVTLNTQLYGLSLAADKVKGRVHLILYCNLMDESI